MTTVMGACDSSKPAVPPTSAAATTSPEPSEAVALPDTPAGAQARWLLAACARLPIPNVEVHAHFDTAFLAQVSPAMLNQALRGSARVRLVSIEVNEPRTLVFTISTSRTHQQLRVTLSVDSQGLISGLSIAPAVPPSPETWDAVDADLRSVAPEVRMLVADVTSGSCRPVHSIDPATAAPLGSTFKLYVLKALGDAIASGKISWSQPLTVTARIKSLPSGELQAEPDGTKVSVRDVAAGMISISDNTAADMLINLLGRPAVEAALTAAGMADPARDRPFLTTREVFILKLDQWPRLAERYVAANEAGRRALLANTVDTAPLPTAAAARDWTTPRDIDSIEWFASADDICRVYTSLAALARRPGLSPIADVLAINSGALPLDPAQWKTIWFKGGSEPGVLTLAYLATTRTGHSYVVAVLAENPSAPIDETSAIPVLLSAIKGAFTLAANG